MERRRNPPLRCFRLYVSLRESRYGSQPLPGRIFREIAGFFKGDRNLSHHAPSATFGVIIAGLSIDLDQHPNWVIRADNAHVLPLLPDGAFRLIYIDPPFNRGRVQRRSVVRTTRGKDGDRTGFAGRRYRTVRLGSTSYTDIFDDYLGFLEPRMEQARRLLTPDGTLYFHIDYLQAHYCKVLLDQIFGRKCFLNEIIWAYDYGGRSKRKWPAKHDTILVYVKDPDRYFFDQDAIERIPYMAPGLVSREKAERGKLPTDVWWHTIVATNSHEKTGYATQKPEGVLRRILMASSRTGDRVLDFFAGSGTTGAVAQKLSRRFVMIDDNPQAMATMVRRLGEENVRYVEWDPPPPSGPAESP